MKPTFPAILLCALAVSALADESKSASASAADAKSAAITIAMTGEVKSPLTLTNGILTQPETTEMAGGGKAVFNFNIPSEGDYLIKAQVDAPGEDANSFFINIDAMPKDPDMVWDMEPTNGFEERTVSWRGNGDPNYDEFTPKRFHLTAGAHKLIIIGREQCRLKELSVNPAK